MKKLLICLFLALGIASLAIAEDRVKVQVQFRKLIFQCKDGTEEVVDANMSGGNTYEHVCADGQWTNSFLNYDGNLSFTPDEYEHTDSKEMTDLKTAKVDEWIYQKNNPPPYVEPTKEELEAQKADLERQVDELTVKISAKTAEVAEP